MSSRTSSPSPSTEEEEGELRVGCDFSALSGEALTALSPLGAWQSSHDHAFLHDLRGRRRQDHANRRVPHDGAPQWKDIDMARLRRKAALAEHWLARPAAMRDRHGSQAGRKLGEYKRTVLLLRIAQEEIELDAQARWERVEGELRELRELAVADAAVAQRARWSGRSSSSSSSSSSRRKPASSRAAPHIRQRKRRQQSPTSVASLATAMGLQGWL